MVPSFGRAAAMALQFDSHSVVRCDETHLIRARKYRPRYQADKKADDD